MCIVKKVSATKKKESSKDNSEREKTHKTTKIQQRRKLRSDNQLIKHKNRNKERF